MRDFSEAESKLWRSLMRLNAELPPVLDQDLAHAVGLSLSEFAVLLTLAEARDGERRMNQLAIASGLSPSRVTRVVGDLQRRGLAEKRRSDVDARGAVAGITEAGKALAHQAYPVQVDRSRELLFDHIAEPEIAALGELLESILKRTIAVARPDSGKR